MNTDPSQPRRQEAREGRGAQEFLCLSGSPRSGFVWLGGLISLLLP